jgi:hypothetical protein
MVRNRDRENTFLIADSGGFQLGKLLWEGNWLDPKDTACQKRRDLVLKWIDSVADYGMTLDVPTWACLNPEAKAKIGIGSYNEAVAATHYNNEYFVRNRNGQAKFLNVLQGSNHTDADLWYNQMKKYCDPKQYPDGHFNGWGMGGQNMSDIHLILRRLVELRHDGLLESGKQDWMHFLGTSKLEWAVLLTDIQNAVRKHHNPTFSISFDCASPFLATANGQIYVKNSFIDRTKWSYKMHGSVDNKKYATDNRCLRDALIQDGIFEDFEESPISKRLLISDICTYAPGALNKIGKEGKTSWDSFSYTLQMGHNVHRHIDAVQEANRRYAAGESCPHMLVDERFDQVFFKDIVDAIFATSDKGVAFEVIEEYNKYWQSIIGTRGLSGKKAINAGTKFSELFEELAPSNAIVEGDTSDGHLDDSGIDEQALDQLEHNVEE